MSEIMDAASIITENIKNKVRGITEFETTPDSTQKKPLISEQESDSDSSTKNQDFSTKLNR